MDWVVPGVWCLEWVVPGVGDVWTGWCLECGAWSGWCLEWVVPGVGDAWAGNHEASTWIVRQSTLPRCLISFIGHIHVCSCGQVCLCKAYNKR